MKRSIITAIAFLAFTFGLGAQNIAYVNTDTILAAMPEYVSAQEQLNSLSDKYKAAIETELGKIESLYQDYQNKKSSMSASQRSAAENEIISKEKVVKEKQRIYFGEDGIMSRKSDELLTPIKANVDRLLKAYAESWKLDFIYDIAAMQGIVYKNENLDVTDQIIKLYNNYKAKNQ